MGQLPGSREVVACGHSYGGSFITDLPQVAQHPVEPSVCTQC